MMMDGVIKPEGLINAVRSNVPGQFIDIRIRRGKDSEAKAHFRPAFDLRRSRRACFFLAK